MNLRVLFHLSWRSCSICKTLSIAIMATLLMNGSASAWNATGHREVVGVAWSALDHPTRARVHTLLASQRLIPETQQANGEAAWMAAALWPDDLRDQADSSRSAAPPPVTPAQWLARASTGEATRRWHFADRNIAKPFHRQSPQGLLEAALAAQIQLLGDPSRSHHDRAIALAWVSHLIADAHQPLHCASRVVPGTGELDAGGNLVTVIDAGRKPPEPLSLHRWWDELPGHAQPGSARFDQDLVRLLRQSLQTTDHDLTLQSPAWIEESFNLARDHVYPGLLPDSDMRGGFLITQDYWLNSRDITQVRLALAGRRLAYVVTQALQDLR